MAANPNTVGKGGKFGDLKRRLWFLLGALVVYRIGAHIPVPGIDPNVLSDLFNSQKGGILGMFNMFSGGALSRFTIFALGIMPYISASIIMQLMSVASPQLEALKKEGEAGRRKITQYTRYGTVALALFQGLGIAVALEAQAGLVSDPGFLFRLTTVTTLVTGTMFLMWLGEQITERGLGNGISILIFGGIAAGLPNAIGGLFELVRSAHRHAEVEERIRAKGLLRIDAFDSGLRCSEVAALSCELRAHELDFRVNSLVTEPAFAEIDVGEIALYAVPVLAAKILAREME